MKKVYLFICFCWAYTFASAQSTTQGVVKDSSGKPISTATIAVLHLPDSVCVQTVNTDSSGRFPMNNLPENCVLVVSSLGYETLHHLPTKGQEITLRETKASQLREVVVSASSMRYQPNGYRYQIAGNKISQGVHTMDLMAQLPHITVEGETIAVLGRPVTTLYIDGLKADAKTLAAIPANQISDIEVSFMSGVQEGASNSGSSLSIRLRKAVDGGFVDNISVATNYSPHYGWQRGRLDNSLLLRRGNLSLRHNIWTGAKHLLSDESYESWYQQTNTRIESRDEYRNWSKEINNRLSVAWQIDPKQTLSAALTHYYTAEEPKHHLSTPNNSYDRLMDNVDQDLQVVGNYIYNLSQMQSLSLQSDYLHRGSKQKYLQEAWGIGNSSLDRQTDMYRFRPTFTLRTQRKEQYVFGIDAQWIRQTEQTSAGLPPTRLQSFVPALYTTYTAQLSQKLRLQAGLRLQASIMETERGEKYHHRHIGIAPSVSLMYLLNPQRQHTLMLQFQRLIDEIPYSAIGAFKTYEGADSYSVGNPDIGVPRKNQLMLILNLWGKLSLINALSYVENPIYFGRYVDPLSPQTNYLIPRNGSYTLFTGHGLELSISPFSWWHTKTTMGVKISNGNTSVQVRGQLAGTLNHNSRFDLSPTIGLGINASYEPTSRYLDREMQSVNHLGGYLYKTFLNDDLTLRLDFSLVGKQRTMVTFAENLQHTYRNETKIPSIGLSISYTFRGGKRVQSIHTPETLQSYQTIQDVK